MSIQSCYFCVQNVEKLWFWMCLRQVSTLCYFFLFFKLCVCFFRTAQWWLRYTGSSNLAGVFDYDLYHRTRACMLCIFVPPLTVPLQNKLLTQALFFELCHCWHIFVPCLAFCVHVTGDLNKTYHSVRSFELYLVSSIKNRAALCN